MHDAQPVRDFVRHHFRHFNAGTLADAADAYRRHVQEGGAVLLAMAGAMSTAELGLSLAEMIRAGKVHAISCTGANLEEDLFNLVAHDDYLRIPHWRDLTPQDEEDLRERHLNRVTDTCIPEEEAIRRIASPLLEEWRRADAAGEPAFPHEFLYRILADGALAGSYQIDPSRSWLVAAAEQNLPIFVPGWEDSTLGSIFTAHCLRGDLRPGTVRGGVEAMMELAAWYRETAEQRGIGFLQIGGGIAGDFAICVVPMLRQDLGERETRRWSYFCQISDATTSYGSYSGAPPAEKISWDKLSVDTPTFLVESDATIVVPLLFACVLAPD